jgi:hypothetical protein
MELEGSRTRTQTQKAIPVVGLSLAVEKPSLAAWRQSSHLIPTLKAIREQGWKSFFLA